MSSTKEKQTDTSPLPVSLQLYCSAYYECVHYIPSTTTNTDITDINMTDTIDTNGTDTNGTCDTTDTADTPLYFPLCFLQT